MTSSLVGEPAVPTNNDVRQTPIQSPESPKDAAMTSDMDEEAALKGLTENVRDQDDLERDITLQASRALIEAEDKKDQRRIEKASLTKSRLQSQKHVQEQKLQALRTRTDPAVRLRIQREIARLESEIAISAQDVLDFEARIAKRHEDGDETSQVAAALGGAMLPNESRRDFLIRTGKITPFAKVGGLLPDGIEGDLANAIVDAEEEAEADGLAGEEGPRSHQNLRLPGFAEDADANSSAVESEFSLRPRKRRKVHGDVLSSDDFTPSGPVSEVETAESLVADDSDDVDLTTIPQKTKRKRGDTAAGRVDLSGIDDGNEAVYRKRLDDWVQRRSTARRRQQGRPPDPSADEGDEWFKPSPDQPDQTFANGMRLPGDIHPSLFDYQKTGVQWLAELYSQRVGGIVGDEMGLGKTVQLISFVAALHYSKMLDKPVIVVAPATVLQQWVNEFHRWWPPLRVSILHSSGSGLLNMRNEDRIEEEEEQDWDRSKKKPSKFDQAVKKIVDRVVAHGHVLVTTYAGLQTYEEYLIPVKWGYAVLDEGHKIRNPNTAITIYCKELRTPNRVILSGTPMQNNLTELWSLFDFIYPMRLGTLVSFRNQFDIPIKLGGYANATNLQIMTAQKCAETLKEAISPYLLQRLKVDVAADLPKKSEQVLFCKLTEPQRQAYELFLKSDDMNAILSRRRQTMYGIDILRKICNHPDLLDPRLRGKPGWGNANKSGKMQVVKSLIPMWKRLGHKTLLFCQGVQMLDVIEEFVRQQDGIHYLRMDGKTPVKERQALVDQFNNNPDLHLFLLTTKVGGLGVNLTGANRVIIFDPDWNPSTDMQARERAWRLGQKKEVTIYRLMTAGTIEEKIYHRQIFKQFLSNKVLKDPKQRTTFNMNDMHDLFTLSSYEDGTTETGELFKGSEVRNFKPRGPKELVLPGSDQGPVVEAPQGALSRNDHGDDIVKSEDDKEADLRTIAGVAGFEAYQEPEKPSANEEDRLMEGIFAQSVHSALEHEQIMGGGKVKADRKILQREADKVAAQAAQSLRRAEQEARNVPIGTVTWTGEYGEAGRPSNRRGRGGAGSSSAGLLSSVSERQGLQTGSPSSTRSSRPGTPTGSGGTGGSLTAKDFEKMIPAFIKRHGGQVPSKLLVDHFNRYCTGDRQAAQFKVALEKVAKMNQRGSTMRGIWSLRPGYE